LLEQGDVFAEAHPPYPAPETCAHLAELPPHRVLVHGGLRDVQQYMVTPALIGQNAAYLREDFPGARLCFFGHSHEQKVYRVDGERIEEIAFRESIALRPEAVYFINPGSVDASRKREHKSAEFAILDSAASSVEFLCVSDDAAATEAKAAAFGYRITPWTDRLYTLRRKLLAGVSRAR
jgi:hypothetical protein